MSTINESDFDSPGYEHLRSYQSMANLYLKLVTLEYRKEFCSLYKCPPIHSAWLIKHKCQMNLDLEPEEYEDPNVTINTIIEAVTLLIMPDHDGNKDKRGSGVMKGFQSGRLRQGYGPEVIWTLNILADRALELSLDERLKDGNKQNRFMFKSKTGSGYGKATGNSNSITIGQPMVGGGLTTRPLGNYQLDDASLHLEDESQASKNDASVIQSALTSDVVDEDVWIAEVERVKPNLRAAFIYLEQEYDEFDSLQNILMSSLSSKKTIEDFQRNSNSLLNTIVNRIDRHLQVINGREKFIQTNMKIQIEEFLKIWRQYVMQLNRNKQLTQQVDARTDKFDRLNVKLRDLKCQYENRIKELSDGSKLKELEVLLDKLNEESADFDMKIGLLLIVYSRIQTRITSQIQYDTR